LPPVPPLPPRPAGKAGARVCEIREKRFARDLFPYVVGTHARFRTPCRTRIARYSHTISHASDALHREHMGTVDADQLALLEALEHLRIARAVDAALFEFGPPAREQDASRRRIVPAVFDVLAGACEERPQHLERHLLVLPEPNR